MKPGRPQVWTRRQRDKSWVRIVSKLQAQGGRKGVDRLVATRYGWLAVRHEATVLIAALSEGL